MQTTDILVHEPGREPVDDDGLRRAFAVQQRLAQAALQGHGLGAVAAAISVAVEGGVLVLGQAGRTIARHDPGGVLGDEVAGDLARSLAVHEDGHPRIVDHPALPAGAYARPIPAPRGGRTSAWLLVTTNGDGRVDEPVRLVVQQAAAILGLELAHRGVASETERRLTASLVADAIGGRSDPAELGRRLGAFGIHGEVAVAVFTVAGAAAEEALLGALATLEVAAAVSTQEVGGRQLLCAVVGVDGRDPAEVAAEARRRLAEELGLEGGGSERAPSIIAAVSRARPAAELARTFQEANWALRAVEHKGAGDPGIGTWRDLGLESLLLSVTDEDVLRLYCDRLLGPVLAGDSAYAGELLRSLELFILHNGQWERAARELHCHRHTLRYRMRKLEELTGRDLSSATDRIEFWLALRARELIAPRAT